MSTARGHHWISQTYLARFTPDGCKDSKLYVVDLDQRKVFSTTPANVCKQRDFNRVESDELAPDALEVALSQFEGLLAPALTEILRAPELTSWDNWNTVLNFMALLSVRNPAVRSHVQKKAEEHWIRTLEDATDTPEKYAALLAKAQTAGDVAKDAKPDFEKHRAFLSERRFTVEFPHGTFVPAEFDTVDDLLPTLGRRDWVIVQAAKESGGFVTTDRPVTLCRRDGKHPSSEHPVDYASQDTLAFFALSPKLLAIGFPGDKGRPPRVVAADRNLVARANFNMIRVCHKQIFAPDDSFEVRPGPKAPIFAGGKILDLFGEWEGPSPPDSGLPKRANKLKVSEA